MLNLGLLMYLFQIFIRTSFTVVVLQLISDCIFCCVKNSKLKSKQFILLIRALIIIDFKISMLLYMVLISTYLFNSSSLRRNHNFLRASCVLVQLR